MTDKPGIEIGEIKGQKLPKDPLKNVASIAVQSMLHDYPIKNGFKIDIDKKIKPGSGIGVVLQVQQGLFLLLTNF